MTTSKTELLKKKLKAFKPLPPIRKDETLTLDYDDVERINSTFVSYVERLEDNTPQKDVSELVEVLRDILAFFAGENENALEKFERIGDWFNKETGYMRPGKDYGMYGPQPPKNLDDIFDEWYQNKVKKSREALKKFGEG